VLEAEVCGSVRIAIGTISVLRLPSQSTLQTVPRRLPRTPAFLHRVQVGNGEWMLVVAAVVARRSWADRFVDAFGGRRSAHESAPAVSGI
jgi:hypothetical protein